MKRWANFYLQMSPIFKGAEFSNPGNESLMSINSRLLASYCVNMMQRGHYNHSQVQQIIQRYQHNIDFSTQYLSFLVGQNHQCPLNAPSEHHLQNLTRFRELVRVLCEGGLKREEMDQLWRLLKGLTADYNLIHELDYFMIGKSLRTLPELAGFCEAVREDALDLVGHLVLPFITAKTFSINNSHFFSAITILNRLGNHITENSSLNASMKTYSLQPSKAPVPPVGQLLGYMSWLLNLRQCNQFIYQHIRPNYLLNQYGSKSVLLLGQWVRRFKLKQLQWRELVLACQVLAELRSVGQDAKLGQDVKDDGEASRAIENMIVALDKQVKEWAKKEEDPTKTEWIGQVLSLDILILSALGRRLMETRIRTLLEHEHCSILLNQQQKQSLVQLAARTQETKLYQDVKKKMKINSILLPSSFAQYLQLIGIGQQFDSVQPKMKWSILSINQLRMVKKLLGALPSTHSLLGQNPLLVTLQKALIDPTASDPQDLKELLSDFQL